MVNEKELVFLDKWTEKGLDFIFHEAFKIKDTIERIGFLPGYFLETPY